MALYSVFGARGFIGAALVRHLLEKGHQCQAIGRGDAVPQQLGHVIYAIGAADFRNHPFETVNSNISILSRLLDEARFESLTFLSSTRVYLRHDPNRVAFETMPLMVDPYDFADVYNLSKILAECLCLAVKNPKIRIARLSNVYGASDTSNNFLTVILRNLLTQGSAKFFLSMTSRKDYIDIRDVVRALELLPLQASSRVINIAGGRNASNREIADLITKHIGLTVEVLPDAPEISFPRISIDRLVTELGIQPRDITDCFAGLVGDLRAKFAQGASSESLHKTSA